jgi:hypothetical protein
LLPRIIADGEHLGDVRRLARRYRYVVDHQQDPMPQERTTQTPRDNSGSGATILRCILVEQRVPVNRPAYAI